VPTTPPAAFVEGVRELVAPAERMGVLAASSLDASSAQPSPIELDGVVGDARRELREFRALRPSDPALRTEQARLVQVMRPIIARMREIRDILGAPSRAGLQSATAEYLDVLEGLPSAVRS
jgi:hypothetical protein